MNWKRLCAVALTGLMLTASLAGCGGSKTSSTQAKDGYPDLKGKKLTLYVSFHEDMAKKLSQMFKQKTGCEVSFVRIPTGEALTRIVAEKDSPKADIFIGGTADAHEVLKSKGSLEAYTPKTSKDIPTEYRDSEGYWTGLYLETLSIAYNKDRFEKEFQAKGVKPPKTLEDLLNPAFKGEIIMPDPKLSGTGFTFLGSILQSMGEEKGSQYLKELKKNVAQYTSSGFKPAQQAGAGEYLIAVNFISDQIIVQNSGYKLNSTVYQNAGWAIVPVAKITKSPNPEAAKAFIDFVTSKEAGEALAKISNAVSTRADVAAPKGSKPLAELPLYKQYDFKAAAKIKQKLLDLFSSL